MRDLVAGLVALALLLVAVSLFATLHAYRRRRGRAHDIERALGRTIIAELPTGDDLTLFSEDDSRFYYGERSVDKDLIRSVSVLINGSPIASCVSRRQSSSGSGRPMAFEDRIEGIARDRWDVAIEAVEGSLLIECGAIRERVSQELARRIFDAVRREVERRDLDDQMSE
jgi:hypothetical protein